MRALIIPLLLAAAPAVADAPKTLQVTSTAFSANQEIPTEMTCQGANVSPPLAWSAVPDGTRSIAILVDDPDAPKGTFLHWLVTGLSPATRSLGKAATLPAPAMPMRNDKGTDGYTGPCPPTGTHHYHFRVYALDVPLAGKPLTRGAFTRAITGHVLAQGELVGTYKQH